MEIIDEELAKEYEVEIQTDEKIASNAHLPLRIIQQEEMPLVIEAWFKKLEEIKINNIPLIKTTFNNDTIIIDPSITIEVINASLKLKEETVFNFLYNLYFYGQDTLLAEVFGPQRFIQVPPLSFSQTGANRFQIDF